MTLIQMVRDYVEVLKPRESGLLTFIGVCSAVIAGGGNLSLSTLLFAGFAILVASAGANGLTNYLDRDVDARLNRTRHRALPSRRIYPPEKVLPLTIGLVVIGLVLAWLLHPYAFIADLVGTAAAGIGRKKVTCVFPQGALAGCAPVLMGWFAVKPALDWEIGLLCLLIVVWLPLHVWSVMISYRDDYINAGLKFFPMSVAAKDAIRIMSGFCIVLYAVSMALYFTGGFTWFYLVLANLLGIVMVYASLRLLISGASRDAWRLYKLSAFPYLGLIFLTMCLDIWLF
jgi:protoheme IX farnesyltransferase